MNKLQLVKSEHFGEIQADIYSNSKDMFMTIDQLAECLQYTSRDAVEKMVTRNSYLKEKEFSVTDKLSATDGKQYSTRIFTEDGIYEVTMLTKTEKAKEFRSWVRKILKSLRTGQASLTSTAQLEKMRAEASQQRARATPRTTQSSGRLLKQIAMGPSTS